MSTSLRHEPPRRRWRPSRLVGLAIAAVVLALSAVVADAAGLSLSGSAPYVASFARTCTGPVVVAPAGPASNGTYTRIAVTGLNSSCAGSGYVSLRTRSGTVVVDTSAPVSGGVFAVTVPAYTPPSASGGTVFVSVGSWPVAATWTPPVSGLGTCVTVDPTTGQQIASCTITSIAMKNPKKDTWGNPGARYINLEVSILGPDPWPPYPQTPNPQERFDVVLNLAGVVPTDWNWATSSASGNSWTAAPGALCSDLPLLHVFAPTWAWNGSSVFLQITEDPAAKSSASLCS